MSGINEWIDSQVKAADVVLFMKGTPNFPQCGFSGQVVQIQIPGVPIRMLGFVTLEDLAGAGLPTTAGEDTVAVYLPMSYQIGGYMVLVPEAWVEPLEIGAEEALRLTLTAGLSGHGSPAAGPPK